jgi:hypothetical protein
MMRVSIRLQWVGFWLVAATLGLRAGLADDVAVSPRKGVLLLDNGEIISGLITPAGDRYDVNLDDGEIHVQRAKVALVARDANECYLHKRARIDPGRIQDHLELTEWCLRHGLLDAAQKQIADARLLDATHPKIHLLETRLKLARENPESLAPIETRPAASSDQQLDTVVRTLPAGTMESFTNNIQPMLLNYCSRSGCHGAQSAGLKLERIPPTRRAGRKPTQRNLQAALAMIDRSNPDQSKLLQAPLQPHGTARSPIFSDREQTQYKMLVQWVFLAAGARGQQVPATVEQHTPPLSQVAPREVLPAQPEKSEVQTETDTTSPAGPPQTAPQPSATEEGATPTSVPPSKSSATTAAGDTPPAEPLRISRSHGQPVLRPAPKRGETIPQFVPKDPFDPAIFNRRFFGE